VEQQHLIGRRLSLQSVFLKSKAMTMNASKFLPLLIAVALSACGEKASTPADAASIAPVATVAVAGSASAAPAAAPAAAAPAASAPAPAAAPAAAPAKAAGGAPDLAKGEKIYAATCLACHGAGVLGAPKFGDKAAWGPRIAKGMDVLHANALNGVNMMPPRGGNAALKDEDLKLAVDYMVSKAK
jgi:cytochrome c5